MDKQNTNTSPKKEFFLWRWTKRMVLGTHRELTASDERYDSPSKLAFKRFFRKKIALTAVIVLVALFLFVDVHTPLDRIVDVVSVGDRAAVKALEHALVLHFCKIAPHGHLADVQMLCQMRDRNASPLLGDLQNPCLPFVECHICLLV